MVKKIKEKRIQLLGLGAVILTIMIMFLVQMKADMTPLYFGTWQFTSVSEENFDEYRGVIVNSDNINEGEAVAAISPLNLMGGGYCLTVEHYGNPGLTVITADGIEVGSYELPDTENETVINLSFDRDVSKLEVTFFAKKGTSESFDLISARLAPVHHLFNNDAILFYAIILIAVIVAFVRYFWMDVHFGHGDLVLLSYVALLLLVSYPLYNDFLVMGDDIEFAVHRIENIRFALSDGQFPILLWPRTLNGYGSIGTLYPYLFMIPSAVLRMMGISAVTSYKACLWIVNIIALVNMRMFARRFLAEEKAVFLATMLFMLAPYRLADVYLGACNGEALAFSFIPLFFLGIYELFYGDPRKWYILTIALTGICQSHVLTSVMICLSVIPLIFMIGRLFSEGRLLCLTKSLCSFALLNLWYIIPFLDTYRKTQIGSALAGNNIFSDRGGLSTLFLSTTTYSHVNLPLSFGIAGMAGALFVLIWIFERKKEADRSFLYYLIAVTLIFTVIQSSLFSWEAFSDNHLVAKFTETMQFAFRFLVISTTALSFLSVYALFSSETLGHYRKHLYYIVMILAIINMSMLLDAYVSRDVFLEKKDAIPATMMLNDYVSDEVDISQLDPERKIVFENGDKTDPMYRGYSSDIEFEYSSDRDTYADLPKINFCVYEAYKSDGTRLNIWNGDNGILRVLLPQTSGSENVIVSLRYPLIYKLSLVISLIAAVAIPGLIIRNKKKKC